MYQDYKLIVCDFVVKRSRMWFPLFNFTFESFKELNFQLCGSLVEKSYNIIVHYKSICLLFSPLWNNKIRVTVQLSKRKRKKIGKQPCETCSWSNYNSIWDFIIYYCYLLFLVIFKVSQLNSLINHILGGQFLKPGIYKISLDYSELIFFLLFVHKYWISWNEI